MKRLILLACLMATPMVMASTTMQLVGKARLDILLWSVYESRLFAPGGTYRPEARPLRLEITYLRDIKAEDLVERTRQEWEHLGLNHSEQDQWLKRLRALWPDISKQDTLALELEEAGHSTFYFNGEPLGSLRDPEFGEQFLAIWLSPDTSRPALRAALLGQAGE